MFCGKCGNQVPDTATFCPICGAPLTANTNAGAGMAQGQPMGAGASVPQGQPMGAGVPVYGTSSGDGTFEPLKTNRGLIKTILLSIITCGIYTFWLYHAMARDLNRICEGDGKHTKGMIAYILLSFITCSIYSFVWNYGFAERMQMNSRRYGADIQNGGGLVLLWQLLGAFLCGIGPFVALYYQLHNLNKLSEAYNAAHMGQRAYQG